VNQAIATAPAVMRLSKTAIRYAAIKAYCTFDYMLHPNGNSTYPDSKTFNAIVEQG
jgi:hypothetical protein